MEAYTKEELGTLGKEEIKRRLSQAPRHNTNSGISEDGKRVIYWCPICEMIVGEMILKTSEYLPVKGIIDAFHSGSWSSLPADQLSIDMGDIEIKTRNEDEV